RFNVKRITFMGMLFALAVVFSILEGMVAIPTMPGVKLGLSNIVTMYCLFFLGWRYALVLVVLKGFSAFITRGVVAAALSIAGGLLSVFVMLLLMLPKKYKVSYLLISIFGGVFHNIGQLIVAQLLVNVPVYYVMLPILLISGVVMGVITGILLRALMPYMQKFNVLKKG
ncbi:MAG: Gx transporter family protein, partial [Oscillospiraceae bacterium]